MKSYIKYSYIAAVTLLLVAGCKKKEYSMGELTTPSDIVINTTIVGQDASHPNGDGSGDVIISVTANKALAFKVDYDANDPETLVFLPTGKVTKKYTKVGLNSYTITVKAYGAGGETVASATKDITVQSDFTLDPALEEQVVGVDGTKTWRVDKTIAGHFGVGPWDPGNVTPSWWSASPNEKVACCNCFYTTTFTFNKLGPDSYTLGVVSPDGAFTKTGALAGGLPGIPATGDEACYSGYTGGTSSFSFVPSSSGVDPAAPSTKTAILLAGTNTFIGYGAQQKEYEILTISDTKMYLRAQGTETGNAWYVVLVAD